MGYASDLNPEQFRTYAMAENKLSELGGWSAEITALEFKELSSLDLGFLLTVTGFETVEIDLMIVDPVEEQEAEPVSQPIRRDLPAISRQGDVFCMAC